MEKKIIYTDKGFRSVCKELLPALMRLKNAVERNGLGYLVISVNENDGVSVTSSKYPGWSLRKSEDGESFIACYYSAELYRFRLRPKRAGSRKGRDRHVDIGRTGMGRMNSI